MLISVPRRLLEPYWKLVLDTVHWLLEVQLPSGNWPSKARKYLYQAEEEEERYHLVQYVDALNNSVLMPHKVTINTGGATARRVCSSFYPSSYTAIPASNQEC